MSAALSTCTDTSRRRRPLRSHRLPPLPPSSGHSVIYSFNKLSKTLLSLLIKEKHRAMGFGTDDRGTEGLCHKPCPHPSGSPFRNVIPDPAWPPRVECLAHFDPFTRASRVPRRLRSQAEGPLVRVWRARGGRLSPSPPGEAQGPRGRRSRLQRAPRAPLTGSCGAGATWGEGRFPFQAGRA